MAQKKIKKSVKNIYDCNTGIPIMVNLVVINELYYGINKADRFYEKKEKGKKKKSVGLFGEIFPISRPRFGRIKKGIRFEMSSEEADKIVNIFGIDIKYFRRDEPIMFDIPNIGIVQWKSFFYVKYSVRYQLSSNVKKKNNADKVTLAIEQLLKEDWEHFNDKENPLYRIWYYFAKGEKYEPISRVDKSIGALKEVVYDDWHKESLDKLEEYSQLLKKHYDYINSIRVISELRKEKNNNSSFF